MTKNSPEGFSTVLIHIDLVQKDENNRDLPLPEWTWHPHIVFCLDERDTETELIREASVDFAAFSDAFAWVFHEMALACLELEFAGPVSSSAATFPQRMPYLPLSPDAGVQQVFAALFLSDRKPDEGMVNDTRRNWWVFADIHFTEDNEFDVEGPLAFAADVADAFQSVCDRFEDRFLHSASTSSSYPSSGAVFVGDGLSQRHHGSLSGFKRVDTGAIFGDEKALEDHLAANSDQMYDDFWLVGRQLSVGTKKADLVGVDDRGALVVVELKRDIPDREALAQVVEYAGFLSHLDFAELARHLSSHSTSPDLAPVADFTAEYRERYGRPPSSGLPIRPALASTAIDEYTAKSIDYLRASGVPLDFFLIETLEGPDGPALLVQRNPGLNLPARWYVPSDLSRRELVDWILEEGSRLEVGPLYRRLYDLIGECLQPSGSWVPRERSDSLGLCRSLSRKQSGGGTSHRECLVMRAYGHNPDRVHVFLYDELVNLAPRKTKGFLRLVNGRRDGIPGKTKGYSFWMTNLDWDRHGGEFRELLDYMGRRWREKLGK